MRTRLRNFSSAIAMSLLCSGFAVMPVQAQDASNQSDAIQKDAPKIATVSPGHIQKYALEPYVESSKHWGAEIAKLAAKNATDGGKDKILLLGSSSIRLWDSSDADLVHWKTVRRGYGGAKFCDAAMYTPNLVKGLQFQGAAVFVANDITGGPNDKTPEEVARLAAVVVESIRAENPNAPVLLISITATPSRFKAWPAIEQANTELAKLADSMDGVYFADTKSSYLDEHGNPIPAYFVKDMLHQNAGGYKVWGQLIADKLSQMHGIKATKP